MKRKRRKQGRTKPCAECGEEPEVLYRVQVQPDGPWVFLCAKCQAPASTRPGYRYGGTWKAHPKR